MQKTTLKQVIDVIKKNDLDVSFFNIYGDEETTVQLKGTQLKFIFEQNPKDFNLFLSKCTLYTPDYRLVSKNRRWLRLAGVLPYFHEWLKEHVNEYLQEVNMEDPLEEAMRQRETIFGDTSVQDSSFFAPDEKVEILLALQKLQTSLQTHFVLDEQQQTSIQAELQKLKDSVDQLNKSDYMTVARRALYDIGMNIAANVIVEGGTAMLKNGVPILYFKLVEQAFSVAIKYLIQ